MNMEHICGIYFSFFFKWKISVFSHWQFGNTRCLLFQGCHWVLLNERSRIERALRVTAPRRMWSFCVLEGKWSENPKTRRCSENGFLLLFFFTFFTFSPAVHLTDCFSRISYYSFSWCWVPCLDITWGLFLSSVLFVRNSSISQILCQPLLAQHPPG